jgi:hypothetical protein
MGLVLNRITLMLPEGGLPKIITLPHALRYFIGGWRPAEHETRECLDNHGN